MNRQELNKEYFDWICELVDIPNFARGRSYQKLLKQLHQIQFNFIIARDANRAEDGTDLRYRFGYDYQLEGSLISSYLDDRPCSVLEMLVALALRCEEHIMSDPDIGDRTGQWFWGMIKNLGLDSMYDSKFDIDYVNFVIDRLLNREYERDGEGGLVTIPDCRQDLRTVEIWYQMMWYLTEVLRSRGDVNDTQRCI